jgi:hypothetical protein
VFLVTTARSRYRKSSSCTAGLTWKLYLGLSGFLPILLNTVPKLSKRNKLNKNPKSTFISSEFV